MKHLQQKAAHSHVVIIVITTSYPHWYPGALHHVGDTDKVRGDLAHRFIHEASRKGIRICLSDWMSAPSWLLEATAHAYVTTVKRTTEKGSAAKRAGMLTASRLECVKAIILCEAEKVSFVTDCIEKVVAPVVSGAAQIVVPKRDEKLFLQSYPRYQYESETDGNTIYNRILKENDVLPTTADDLDFFFGPRVFHNDPHVVDLFTRKYLSETKIEHETGVFDTDDYSNSNYFPVVEALRTGGKVVSVEAPFSYPATQRANEESQAQEKVFIEKRRHQRVGLITELLHFIKTV